ncbi:MAG: four helix bundle protein [Bacteroidaceae bacterium]|nr:four helix bundle protein [Bacteroidaceae bacterium]MBR1787872.1 four helix bundle protein [Bacteroidaceae bacterium]
MPLHTGNLVADKSYDFANRIVKAYRYLKYEKGETILSKQLVRSGTAIRALIGEAKFAQSKKDFINKNYIALKEANESVYWLHLLYENDYINEKTFQSIQKDAQELVALLVTIVKNAKQNAEAQQ